MKVQNRLELRGTPSDITTGLRALLLVVVALVLLVRGARGQDELGVRTFDLLGYVYGEGNRALVGAFVRAGGSDWGSLTDENGRFVVRNAVPGRLELVVEQLGYETLEWVGVVTPTTTLDLRLAPQPLVLEGLTVVADRFQARRNATATSVRWFDRGALATAPHESTLDFLSARGVTRIRCRSDFGRDCVRVRGQLVVPTVWVDEAPILAGMDYLDVIPPHELYMVEVYASGRHIRAYTSQFMEHSAKTGLHPIPFMF
jgi:hypothetical protein